MKKLIISLFTIFPFIHFDFVSAMAQPVVSRGRMTRTGKYVPMQNSVAQPAVQPFAQPALQRKLEFSNQSDQYVTVWIPTAQGCWQPTLLYPYTDSGILNPIELGTIYIYTKANGHFIMQMGEHGSYRLINETPNPEARGHSAIATIKSMPYDQVRDVVVVVSPDGSVNFSKRNP